MLWHYIHQAVTCKRTDVLDIYLLASKCVVSLPMAMSKCRTEALRQNKSIVLFIYIGIHRYISSLIPTSDQLACFGVLSVLICHLLFTFKEKWLKTSHMTVKLCGRSLTYSEKQHNIFNLYVGHSFQWSFAEKHKYVCRFSCHKKGKISH